MNLGERKTTTELVRASGYFILATDVDGQLTWVRVTKEEAEGQTHMVVRLDCTPGDILFQAAAGGE